MKDRYEAYGATLAVELDGDEATLSELFVPEAMRQQGWGKKLVREACDDADAEGIRLWLQPVPYLRVMANSTIERPGMNADQLAAWYRTFGFRFSTNRTGWMTRPPKKES